MTDFAKFDRPGQLHVAFQAYHKYFEKKSQLPRSRNKVSLWLCVRRFKFHVMVSRLAMHDSLPLYYLTFKYALSKEHEKV